MAIDFTGTAPITGGGQVFVRNSNGEWERANVTAPGVVVQTFTASGTYTPSPGMICCIVEAVGGGGGGGGADGDGAAGVCGGGGGAGAYVRSILTAADIGASQTVTIGAGGAGGTAGANNGSNGGDTSLGSLVVADGGSGGNYGQNSTSAGSGGDGGQRGNCTGDFIVEGFPGASGFNGSTATYSEMGVGGGPGGGKSGTYNEAGYAADDGSGGGGGGGLAWADTANNYAGGDGGDGYIIITEFIRQSVLSPTVYDGNGDPLMYLGNTDAGYTSNPASAAVGIDLGAGSYPTLVLYAARNDTSSPGIILRADSASPAASDNIGFFDFIADDSAGNTTTYGAISCLINDPTNGSEDGKFDIDVFSAGSRTTKLTIDGDGLKFNGDTAAANALSDYETGTFTPVITQGWTSVTYSNQVGGYTKIGDQVFFDMFVLFSGTSAANHVQVGGLPFTVGGGSSEYSLTVGYLDAPVNQTDIYGYTYASISYAVLYGPGGAACNSNGAASGDYIYISGSYRV